MRSRDHVRLTSDGFGFHTIELKQRCTEDQFQRIRRRLARISKDGEFHELGKYGDDRWCCEHFCKRGIRIYLSEVEGSGFTHYVVKLVVNPRLLFDPDVGYLGIMPYGETALDLMEQAFTGIMREIKLCDVLPEFMKNWRLTRIDLCVNFVFDRIKLPRQFIDLIRRGPMCGGYKRETNTDIYNSNSVTEAMEKHSVKFSAGDEYLALVVYDKAYQCKKKRLSIPRKFESVGILRVELQCRQDWLKTHLPKKYHPSKASDHDLYPFKNRHTIEIIKYLAGNSRNLICQYAQKLLPDGDYCRYGILKEHIKAAGSISEKVAKRMILIAKSLRDDTFGEAEVNLLKQMSKKQLRTAMDCFRILGLSPIPLDKACKLKRVHRDTILSIDYMRPLQGSALAYNSIGILAVTQSNVLVIPISEA